MKQLTTLIKNVREMIVREELPPAKPAFFAKSGRSRVHFWPIWTIFA